MKLPSFYILLLLSLISQSLHCCCQQVSLKSGNCTNDDATTAGYLCNGLKKSCTSFVTFRSKSPYDSPLSIANLLGSEATSIASVNNISSSDKIIPSNQIVFVPITCSCSGNISQHATPYDVKAGDNYSYVAKTTYQGLTNCQTLVRDNTNTPDAIQVGVQIAVPVLCACPTANQISDGVSSLLLYTLDSGDLLESVTEAYGVDHETLLTDNLLPSDAIIPPMTPFLVRLEPSSCKLNPHLFFCICSLSQGYLPNSSFNTLYCDHLQTDAHHFPVRLIASLGNLF